MYAVHEVNVNYTHSSLSLFICLSLSLSLVQVPFVCPESLLREYPTLALREAAVRKVSSAPPVYKA